MLTSGAGRRSTAMKNNKGAVLVITSILLSLITLLGITAFSLFYYEFTRIDRAYKRMRDRLDLEIIAQEVFVLFTEEASGDHSSGDVITVYYDEDAYYIIYEGDDVYEYIIEKQYKKASYKITVSLKATANEQGTRRYRILLWEITNA